MAKTKAKGKPKATAKPARAKSKSKSKAKSTKTKAKPKKTSPAPKRSAPKAKAKAKPTAKPKAKAKPAAKSKPAKLTFAPLGDVPAWKLATASAPAYEVVHQPKDLKPLATPKALLEGHSNFVQALAFSRDGKTLVTGSEDATMRVWDVGDPANPKCLATLSDHSSAVNCVSFSHDGTQLLSSSDDYTVKVWSVPGFEVVQTLRGHSDYVSKVFPAGPNRAVSASKDGTLRLWDTKTGDCIHTMEHGGWTFTLGVSPDGKFAVAGNDRNTIRMWNLETGAVERVLLDASDGYIGDVLGYTLSADNRSGVGHKSYPKQIVFAPNGATFLSAEVDLIEWDTATGAELGRTDGDGWPIAGVAYIADRATWLREHADDVERSFVEQLERNAEGVRMAYGDWLEERGRLAEANSVRRHGAFRYVFAGTNDAVYVLDLGMKAIVAQAAWTHGDVHNVAVSPDGRIAASGSHDGVVALWDIDALLYAGLPDRHLQRPREMAVTNEGIVLSTASDRTARLWQANATKNERLLPPTNGIFADAAFTPDGKHALVLSEQALLQVFDAKTGELRGSASFSEEEEGRYHPFSEYEFLSDGRLLSASSSGPLAIWSFDPPKVDRFEGEAGHVTGLAVHEPSDLVVTAEYASDGEPMKFKLWSLANKNLVREIELKAKETQYSPSVVLAEADGELRIVAGTSEGGVVILDLEGNVLHAVKVSGEYLNQLVSLGEGKVVVVGDPTVLVDAATGDVVAQIAWPEKTGKLPIHGTSRVILTGDDGVGLVDFASATLWPQSLVPVWSAYASPNGKYVVASARDEAVAGAPILLRCIA